MTVLDAVASRFRKVDLKLHPLAQPYRFACLAELENEVDFSVLPHFWQDVIHRNFPPTGWM